MASNLIQLIPLGALAGGNQPASKIDQDFQQLIDSGNTLATYGNYYVDTGASNALVVQVAADQIVTLAAGLPIQIKAAATNTGATTLNIKDKIGTPLGPQPVLANGVALMAGQVQIGVIHAFQWDGAQFHLLNPATGVGSPIPMWSKVGSAIPYTSFSFAGTSFSIPLFNLSASGVISGIKIKHSTAFSGGAISACTISVGITGTNAKYAGPFDVFLGTNPVQNYAYLVSGGIFSENSTVATLITVTADSTGANLNALTAGVVDVWALLSVAN